MMQCIHRAIVAKFEADTPDQYEAELYIRVHTSSQGRASGKTLTGSQKKCNRSRIVWCSSFVRTILCMLTRLPAQISARYSASTVTFCWRMLACPALIGGAPTVNKRNQLHRVTKTTAISCSRQKAAVDGPQPKSLVSALRCDASILSLPTAPCRSYLADFKVQMCIWSGSSDNIEVASRAPQSKTPLQHTVPCRQSTTWWRDGVSRQRRSIKNLATGSAGGGKRIRWASSALLICYASLREILRIFVRLTK